MGKLQTSLASDLEKVEHACFDEPFQTSFVEHLQSFARLSVLSTQSSAKPCKIYSIEKISSKRSVSDFLVPYESLIRSFCALTGSFLPSMGSKARSPRPLPDSNSNSTRAAIQNMLSTSQVIKHQEIVDAGKILTEISKNEKQAIEGLRENQREHAKFHTSLLEESQMAQKILEDKRDEEDMRIYKSTCDIKRLNASLEGNYRSQSACIEELQEILQRIQDLQVEQEKLGNALVTSVRERKKAEATLAAVQKVIQKSDKQLNRDLNEHRHTSGSLVYESAVHFISKQAKKFVLYAQEKKRQILADFKISCTISCMGIAQTIEHKIFSLTSALASRKRLSRLRSISDQEVEGDDREGDGESAETTEAALADLYNCRALLLSETSV